MQDSQGDQLEGFLLPGWLWAANSHPCWHLGGCERIVEEVLALMGQVPKLHQRNLHLLCVGVLGKQLLEALALT